jgi:YtcA family
MPSERCSILPGANAAFGFLILECTCLAGCSSNAAPSFDLFGAFFPAWLFCGIIGVVGALAARAVFVGTKLSNVLPFQLFVCTAIGVIIAIMAWLLWFGR